MNDKSFSILYVDDEENNLFAFKAAFRRFYNIHIALSGEEGMEILRNNSINLIITDQRMPKMRKFVFGDSCFYSFAVFRQHRQLMLYDEVDCLQNLGAIVGAFFRKSVQISDGLSSEGSKKRLGVNFGKIIDRFRLTLLQNVRIKSGGRSFDEGVDSFSQLFQLSQVLQVENEFLGINEIQDSSVALDGGGVGSDGL